MFGRRGVRSSAGDGVHGAPVSRLVRRLLIALAVLALLVVGADRVGVRTAQYAAAKTLQASEGLAKRPTVTIHGFPFLTQLANGRLDHVSVVATGVPLGTGGRTVVLARLDVDLHNVTVKNNFTQVHVASGSATGLIPYSELSREVGATIRYVGAGSGGGRVEAARAVRLSGRSVEATVGAQVSTLNGVLHFVGLTAEYAGAPASVQSQLRHALGTRLPLNRVPFGLRVQSVQALASGIEFTLAGTNLTFSR